MKRALQIIAGVLVVWIAVLFVLGFALAGRTERRIAGRLAESLQATATIESSSLGLVRGYVHFEGLQVRREDAIGKLVLDVGEVDCDLMPLGIALVDRNCGELAISDVRLEASTVALFRLQRAKRTPFRADHVTLDNASFELAPGAFLPSVGQVRVRVEHAEAGATTFKTPLSFLFAIDQLRAAVDLPAGITLELSYADGKLTAAGGLFGSTPITLPVALPAVDSTDDAKAEIGKLVTWAKEVAERFVAERAKSWLEKHVPL